MDEDVQAFEICEIYVNHVVYNLLYKTGARM